MKFRVPIAMVLHFAVLFPLLAVAAPAGALDPTFGTGGKRTVALPQDPLEWNMVRDAAGRIYLIASEQSVTELPDDQFIIDTTLLVTRLRHDGTLDTTYGDGGTVMQKMEMFSGDPTAAAIQPDGKIVVGFRYGKEKTCRLLESGSLDPSYGAAEAPGCSSEGNDVFGMGIQADGRIVVVGLGTGFAGVVTRLERNGTLDTGFGDGGSVELTPGSGSVFTDVDFAANGDIIAVGQLFPENAANADFLVVRLRRDDGQPVVQFGTWGLATAAFNEGGANHEGAQAVDVLPDGRIAVAGYANTAFPGDRPAVAMFTNSGAPDESFGPGGKRIYDNCKGYEGTSHCNSEARDIAVMPDGKLAIAGKFEPDVNGTSYRTEFYAMRLLPNGTPDPGFGSSNSLISGMSVVAFDLSYYGGGTNVAEHITIEGRRILLVGSADITSKEDLMTREAFALARLDHGLTSQFMVTPKPGPGGMVSPTTAQKIGHSDRAEFVVIPDPGFELHEIEKGPGYCDGGMDGEVFVSAPVQQPCEVHLSFQRHDVFADGFE